MAHFLDFRKPETPSEVALYLGISAEDLERAVRASRDPEGTGDIYVRHRIPKKNPARGYRVVWDVNDPHIRDTHKALARRFSGFIAAVDQRFPHPAAFGYIRGRGIKGNAHQHCGHRLLLRCDIQDFFPTIDTDRLRASFLKLGIQERTASLLASFATIEETLALGLNASPLLANLVCLDLDDRLAELSRGAGCVYTRYADDISISGPSLPNQIEVEDVIVDEGFSIAMQKSRITKLGQAHFVTGLSISDPKAPHVPRLFKRRLRQELYYCETHSVAGHLARTGESFQHGINRIDGTVHFVASVESAHGDEIRRRWRRILAEEHSRVSYEPRHDSSGTNLLLLFDEAEFQYASGKHLALACISTEYEERLRDVTKEVLRDHTVDPFSAGRKEKLEKHGIHSTDAHEELRTKYVTALSTLPFRVYVAFGALGSDYSQLYAKLLGKLLPRRLMGADGSLVKIGFEVNPKIELAVLQGIVDFEFSDLEQANNRRPATKPEVLVLKKPEEPLTSVPDALLHVFCRYFSGKSGETDGLRFERLRDKYRYIVNVDTGEEYSRRHPIGG